MMNRLSLSSSAFDHNQSIPSQYTCDGEGYNPPLLFHNVPVDAVSLILLVDDPDVPKHLKPDGMFDHWVVYNIDPKVADIAENCAPFGDEGLNSSGKLGYTSPCPPDREHRYFFKLYTLDARLTFEHPELVTKKMVEEKMQGHILDQAELVGLYNRG
jgi:Raf kinase inhibitor-like YbhB/YbcL family protein